MAKIAHPAHALEDKLAYLKEVQSVLTAWMKRADIDIFVQALSGAFCVQFC